MSDDFAAGLRARFRTTCVVRLADMRRQLEILGEEPDDFAALESLSRHFHALAGLGTTYGYPGVTAIGDAGEDSIVPLVRQRLRPSPEVLAEWSALVSRATEELTEE